jgi:hypothetical protein
MDPARDSTWEAPEISSISLTLLPGSTAGVGICESKGSILLNVLLLFREAE